jgi:serine O-acetyltransferase
MTVARDDRDVRLLRRTIRSRHPGLRQALLADAQMTAAHRGERWEFRSRADAAIQMLRLIWTSDAFLGQALYRLKARLQGLGVPALPRLIHRLGMAIAQISIGDLVVVHPGVYILHGQTVIDGITEIHSGAVIGPFVTIGLREGEFVGPTVERNVTIGAGAKVLGELRVGARARIGANAVVLDDVAEDATAVGVPARAVSGAGADPPG